VILLFFILFSINYKGILFFQPTFDKVSMQFMQFNQNLLEDDNNYYKVFFFFFSL